MPDTHLAADLAHAESTIAALRAELDRVEKKAREWEEWAIDRLLRWNDEDDDRDLKLLPPLTEAEIAAMEALGPDFINRLLAGDRPLKLDRTEDLP